MNKLTIFVLLLLSCSCTSQRNKSSTFTETVNLGNPSKKIELDPSGEKHDTYGPRVDREKQVQIQEKVNRKPVIAIDLVPALYASLGYLSLFKELEKNKIYPNIINASGFSLVIAVLFAKYRSASKLEWKIFALLRKLKGVKVHTSSWYNKIETFLKSEFKQTRLEQLKILITIPTANVSKRLVTAGNLIKVVNDSIKITNSASFINRPHYDYSHKINTLGADMVFLISALPDKFNFKFPNGFAWGLYTRLSGVLSSVSPNTLKISSELKFIDTLPNLSDMLINSKSDVHFISDKISQQVEDWISKNN